MSRALIKPAAIEHEEATESTLPQQAQFREEKSQVHSKSLGGSGGELTAPSTDSKSASRSQFLNDSGSLTASPSLTPVPKQKSSEGNFQGGANDENDHSEQPGQANDLPVGLDHSQGHNAPVEDRGQTTTTRNRSNDENRHSEQPDDQADELPVGLDHRRESNVPEEDVLQMITTRNRCMLARVAILTAAAIGCIAGAVVALQRRGATSSPPSTINNGTESTEEAQKCALDRETLILCENGILAVPHCATEAYNELIDTYLPEEVSACDSTHQGLVALAVAQTNDIGDVLDPTMFFAMSTLYFALQGTLWRVDSNWLEGTSPCSAGSMWHGVVCSSNRSIGISLENNHLQGSLPTEIGLLSDLTTLVVALNDKMTGTLPSEVGLLKRLQRLDIRRSSLSSTLPSEIGELEELTHLILEGAPLTGTIPIEIGNLLKLDTLILWGNQFTGSFPTEFGYLVNLRCLEIVDIHGITGSIPSQLVALTSLEKFHLSLPSMHQPTPFPEVFLLATNLRGVRITETFVTGNLPTLSQLRDLEELHLYNLQTTGTIPTEVGLLSSNLVKLFFDRLNLEGTIPTEIGLLTKLTHLVIREEPRLTGTLPSELGNLSTLTSLYVNSNGLRGTVPTEICGLNLPPGTFRFDMCHVGKDDSCLSNTCQ